MTDTPSLDDLEDLANFIRDCRFPVPAGRTIPAGTPLVCHPRGFSGVVAMPKGYKVDRTAHADGDVYMTRTPLGPTCLPTEAPAVIRNVTLRSGEAVYDYAYLVEDVYLGDGYTGPAWTFKRPNGTGGFSVRANEVKSWTPCLPAGGIISAGTIEAGKITGQWGTITANAIDFHPIITKDNSAL